MPRFNITAEFDLETEIEPDLYGSFDSGDSENFTDDSSFGTAPATVEGGVLTFTLEAEDEYNAERKAEEIIDEGHEVTDRNDLTWSVTNVRFEVEEVEEPMTKEMAKLIVIAYLDSKDIDDDLRKALGFLLTLV